jgi:phosphoribosylglycinamide formyltransferase-1
MPDRGIANRLVVLISGNGRNLQGMIDAVAAGRLSAELVHVFCDRQNAAGLTRAWRAGIPTTIVSRRDHESRAAFDRALARRIAAERPDWIALAGFMRILSSEFVQQFAGKLLNIHPSLLPKYKGLDTHSRVLKSGDPRHGATVHFVSDDLDGGPPVLSGSVAVREDDDAATLSDRVMRRVEVHIYPRVLEWAAQGRLALRDQSVFLDGEPLASPLHESFDDD